MDNLQIKNLQEMADKLEEYIVAIAEDDEDFEVLNLSVTNQFLLHSLSTKEEKKRKKENLTVSLGEVKNQMSKLLKYTILMGKFREKNDE